MSLGKDGESLLLKAPFGRRQCETSNAKQDDLNARAEGSTKECE